MLFDQSNGVITVCEIKHSENSFIIDKDYAQNLKEKINIYQQHTRTQKQIFLAMITSGGLRASKYSDELVSQEVSLQDLFSQ